MFQSQQESTKYTALCAALKDGCKNDAKYLISKNAPVNPQNSISSYTPLHWAVINFYDIGLVQMLVDRGANILSKNDNGQTPVHLAIGHNKADIANLLLNSSCNICDDLLILIEGAVANGYKKIAKFLVQYSNNKNTCVNVINALSAAVEDGRINIVNYLLQHCEIHGLTNQYILYETIMKNGPRSKKFLDRLHQYSFTIFTREDEKKFQIICEGVENQSLNKVEHILKSGINININNKNTGLAPLHVACIIKDRKMIQLLIEYNANINIKVIRGVVKKHTGTRDVIESFIGKPPLFIAVHKSDIDTAKLLLLNGADIKEEQDILLTAVQKLSKEMVELLIDYGANVNAIDESQKTPLIYSIETLIESSESFGSQASEQSSLNYDEIKPDIVELLLKKEANPNPHVKKNINSPLQAAIIKGDSYLTKLLLQYNADVNYSNADGDTPLHLAANGHLNILELLLQHNPNINVANKDRTTPLHRAALSDNYDVFDKLLKMGANVNDVDKNGNTVLHLVCQKSQDSSLVQLLLNYNADVNANTNRITPLHTFLHNNKTKQLKEYIKILEVLLKNKANVNAVDHRGETPLLYACINLRRQIGKVLLKYGANANCANSKGLTPLDIAVRRDDPSTFEQLLIHGADINRVRKKNKTVLDDIKDSLMDVDFTGRTDIVYNLKLAKIRIKFFNIAKEHIIKLQCAALRVRRRNLHLLYDDDDDPTLTYMVEEFELSFNVKAMKKSKFEDRCRREIEALKNEKIGFISWYSVLTKSTHELTKFVKNEKVINTLKSSNFEKKFPLYASIIRNRFPSVMKRHKLLKNAQKRFATSIFSRLPFICVDQIFSYLDIKDLKAFISAMK